MLSFCRVPDVAQVFNLLYRRFSNLRIARQRRALEDFKRAPTWHALPIENRRYGRLENLRYEPLHGWNSQNEYSRFQPLNLLTKTHRTHQ